MIIKLTDFLEGDLKPFGSMKGRRVFSMLLPVIQESLSPVKISIAGIQATDVTFVRESIGALSMLFLGKKSLVIVNPCDSISSNWVMGIRAHDISLVVFNNGTIDYIGAEISNSNKKLLRQVRNIGQARTSDIANNLSLSVQNVSTRLKRLAYSGLILRIEKPSRSGGTEFLYSSIV